MTPRVSVVMTAYNRASFIGPAIESVLAQTFDDFELVVVDDCSTDATLAIARQYERRDSRVRVVSNERNLGDYGNRNQAATLVRAPLFKYHDSDDLMYPHCLSVMVSMLSSEPRAGIGLSPSKAWQGGACPMLLTPRMAYEREFFGGGGLFNCGPASAIFRTETFRRFGGFENVGPPSDLLFWLRACTTENLLLLPADLFWYRVHPNQELNGEAGQIQYARAAGWIWEALDAPECPLSPGEREQAKRNRAFHLARRTVQDMRRGQWHSAARRLRYCGMSIADWLKYLRPPRRSRMAGTPLAADGEFLTPSWAAPQDEPGHKR